MKISVEVLVSFKKKKRAAYSLVCLNCARAPLSLSSPRGFLRLFPLCHTDVDAQ